MSKPYEMLADSRVEESVKKGATVFACAKHDYGCASDDTRITGVHHVSVTKDPGGDYPFFTVPFKDLKPL